MSKVYRVGPLHFPFAGRPRDVLRAAVAGAVLCGLAGAPFGAHFGFEPFQGPGPAAGATVEAGWRFSGALGIGGLFACVAAGTLAGGLVAFVAGALSSARGSAAAVVAVGVLGGLFAGATWGQALAQECVLTISAYNVTAPRPLSGGGEGFSVTTGNLRMIGKLNRRTNVPVLASAILAGTALGAMVGRAMAGAWPAPGGEIYAGPAEGSFPLAASHPVPLPGVAAGSPSGA
jgi:hypothetical protein